MRINTSRPMPILFIFAIIFVCTALHSMDRDGDSSDCIITMHSEEEDKPTTHDPSVPLNPALFKATPQSEVFKKDVFEALLTNNLLLQYLTYPETHKLCLTSKECLKHCKRYLEEQITVFKTKYAANTKNSKTDPLRVKYEGRYITINQKTVSFDLSGNYAYGSTRAYGDGFYYFFSYPACIVHNECNFGNQKLSTKIALHGSLARLHTQALTQRESLDTEQNLMCIDLPLISFTSTAQRAITQSLICTTPNYRLLVAIDLSHNKLQSFALGMLNPCPNLKIVDLSNNELTDLDTKKAECKLHDGSLILHHNKLSDKLLLKQLADTYKYLHTIDLGHNAFQEIEFPEYDSTLPSGADQGPFFIELKNLSLAHNQLTHLNLDTLLRMSINDTFENADISGNPISTVIPPTFERKHFPRIHCENIPAPGLALLAKHAVSTKKTFKDILFTRTLIGSIGGVLPMMVGQWWFPKLALLSQATAAGLIIGTIFSGIMCSASTARLLVMCCNNDEDIFHDHYSLKSHTTQENESEDNDTAELTELNIE